MKLKRQIPNLLTALRIVCSVLLLFAEPFSALFFGLYFAAGASDMLDGFLARKLFAKSDFGSKLDSAADFVFIAACAAKLFPVLKFSGWVVWAFAAVFLLKLIAVLSGIVVLKKIIFLHTAANKLAGLLLFAAVPAMALFSPDWVAAALLPVAAFAAIQEGHFIRRGKTE